MNLQGERRIPASVERTWNALNDPETLKSCISGCESLELTGDNEYQAVMVLRIGPVNAKFKGKLQLTDILPNASYSIHFEGQGGVAGFGKGQAQVMLSPDGEATTLQYDAKAQVGGKIAQIGSRLVSAAAAKVADGFFKAFEQKMSEPAPAADAGADAAKANTDQASAAAPGNGTPAADSAATPTKGPPAADSAA